MFETDYPHSDTTWPDCIGVARKLLDDLPPTTQYKIPRQRREALPLHPGRPRHHQGLTTHSPEHRSPGSHWFPGLRHRVRGGQGSRVKPSTWRGRTTWKWR